MPTNELGNRQRGTLGGRLGRPVGRAGVTLAAADSVAHSRSGQHLLWMLVNLLARQADEIGQLSFDISPGVRVQRGLSPLLAETGPLTAALSAGARDINPALGVSAACDRHLRVQVGPGRPSSAGQTATLFASATSWGGYSGTDEAPWAPVDGNPVGPYVAACLTAGEVFKVLRDVQAEDGTRIRGVWYDAYRLQVVDRPPDGPALPDHVQGLSAVLAGVGAVGTALLHTLYATPGLTAHLVAVDNDFQGIEATNLNRYTLFGNADLAHLKASRADQRVSGSGLTLSPRDLSWDAWAATYPADERDLVLSCVDNNRARHAIQNALPGVILSASTLDMRAQLVAFERLPGVACLRCHNPAEADPSDDDVISALRSHKPSERASLAAEQGVEPEVLERFLTDPPLHCGLISGETLRRFGGAGAGEQAWSVGFVSAMAGILLAAEYLKRSVGGPSPRLSSDRNMARFQFWHPGAAVNGVHHWPPAAGCLCATPEYLRAVSTHPVSPKPPP